MLDFKERRQSGLPMYFRDFHDLIEHKQSLWMGDERCIGHYRWIKSIGKLHRAPTFFIDNRKVEGLFFKVYGREYWPRRVCDLEYCGMRSHWLDPDRMSCFVDYHAAAMDEIFSTVESK